MKDFFEFKDEIYKCSKCGLCQAVCPVFQQNHDECCVSRGKFIILNGLYKNELQLTESVKKNFDICTSCGACSDFCPSNIDACEIFSAFKHHYFVNKNKILFFYTPDFFEFKLKCISLAIKIYRFFKLDLIINNIQPLIKKFGKFGNFINFCNSIIEIKPLEFEYSQKSDICKKVVFFRGCYNKYINPQSEKSALNLIKSLGCECVVPDFPCCGISKYFEGIDIEKNVEKIISLIPKDTDYIVSDCATCVSALNKYAKMFPVAEIIQNKIVSVEDLLISCDFQKTYTDKIKITYHKPCHGKDYTNFLKTLKNIKFVEIEQSCCGFAGEFALKHPKIAFEIGDKKAQQIVNSGAEIVLTSCPSCIAGLKRALNHTNVEVLSITEFLTKI